MATLPAKSPQKAWLINPWVDLSFFIATPLAIIPAYHFLSALLSLTVLKLGILSISATGHHLPGFIRAYTDPSIFRQFRIRLLVVPALLLFMTALSAYFKLSLIFFLLITWGTWHGSMQILGFLRIYDVKAGFMSARTARLDFWMCLTWFVQAILWGAPKKMSVFSSFYMAGGPLIPGDWARGLEWGWTALTLGVTLAYAVNAGLDWRRHGYLNGRKLLCMAASIGFWAYCMMAVDNLIVGLILWEIFHDLQYNVFVWSYNRNRVEKGLSQSPLERFLFRADWKRIGIYSACILAYGCLGFLTQDVLNVYQNQEAYGDLLHQIGNVFAASALIHFYLDGFIWKVRDGKVQRDLGLQTSESFRKAPWPRHGVFVAALFSISLALGASEYLDLTAGQRSRQSANLADLVPKSPYGHFLLASQLKAENRFDSAAVHYLWAIRLDTNYNFCYSFAADMKYRAGDTLAAIGLFEKAIRLDPDDTLSARSLANLHLLSGQYEKARQVFAALVESHPTEAGDHFQLAFALLQMRRGLDAKPHLERSLELDPRQPKALNYLGMVEQALGRKEKAQELFRRSLTLDPTYSHARENLASTSR